VPVITTPVGRTRAIPAVLAVTTTSSRLNRKSLGNCQRAPAERDAGSGEQPELVITEKSVSNVINALFGKLGLPPAAHHHRRVLGVLNYLEQR